MGGGGVQKWISTERLCVCRDRERECVERWRERERETV